MPAPEIPVSWWIAFNAFVIFMLALDLGVFNRKAHVVKLKEALGWTAVWIAMAMLFNWWVWVNIGPTQGKEFLAGYLLEKSLSVDNVFVFAVIFSFFKVPREYQHKVLFWGIFGALVLRAGMIAGGAALITSFSWIIYIFAALLVYTGIKMFFHDEDSVDPGKSIAVRLLKRTMPMTSDYVGSKFLVKQDGKWFATPLLAVLLCVEVTDVIFAVDSGHFRDHHGHVHHLHFKRVRDPRLAGLVFRHRGNPALLPLPEVRAGCDPDFRRREDVAGSQPVEDRHERLAGSHWRRAFDLGDRLDHPPEAAPAAGNAGDARGCGEA